MTKENKSTKSQKVHKSKQVRTEKTAADNQGPIVNPYDFGNTATGNDTPESHRLILGKLHEPQRYTMLIQMQHTHGNRHVSQLISTSNSKSITQIESKSSALIQRQLGPESDAALGEALARQLEDAVGDVESLTIREGRNRAPVIIENIRDRALRQRGGVLARTADQLDNAVHTARLARNVHKWGTRTVHLIVFINNLRRLDEAMNRNQDAGTSQTVLQSAQRLPALMDSVADLIGDIINHPGLRLALQQIAHGAGNLGQAIGEQLADRLSDISAVQGGGRQQTQGLNSPIQSVEQHMAIESALNGVGLHFLDTGSPERENVAQQEIETKIGEMIDLLYNQLEEEFSPENRRTFLQNFLIELHILDQPPLGNAWAGYEEDTLEQLNNIRDVFINAKERASHNLTALNQIYLMLGRLLQDRQDLLRNWIPLLHPRWPHSAIWLANNLQRRADRQEGLCDPRNLNLQSPGRRSPAAR